MQRKRKQESKRKTKQGRCLASSLLARLGPPSCSVPLRSVPLCFARWRSGRLWLVLSSFDSEIASCDAHPSNTGSSPQRRPKRLFGLSNDDRVRLQLSHGVNAPGAGTSSHRPPHPPRSRAGEASYSWSPATAALPKQHRRAGERAVPGRAHIARNSEHCPLPSLSRSTGRGKTAPPPNLSWTRRLPSGARCFAVHHSESRRVDSLALHALRIADAAIAAVSTR